MHVPRMYRTLVLALLATTVGAQDETEHSFTRLHLNKHFTCEGASFGDINRDGKGDIVAGPYWYEGPGFEKKHEIYEPKRFDILRYSNNFFAFVHDFDGDEWNDVLFIGFPGQDASWFRNPQGKEEQWVRHRVFQHVDNESPMFQDVVGDGKPELICQSTGRMGWAAPDWDDPGRPWVFHPVSAIGVGGKFTHGLGVGDVDGDGRHDILGRHGWWQQPKSLQDDPQWTYHEAAFAGRGGAQMYVFDFNGDGDNDVLSSWNAHGFGLAWFEHVKRDGKITFERRQIMGDKPEHNRHGLVIGNLHAIDFVDMNADGLPDIVTGSRFWAHGGGDPADHKPPYVHWFELVRGDDGVDFVPHQIDDDSGVGTQVVAGDVNGDGTPDVVVGNKKGVFVHLHHVKERAPEPPPEPEPEPEPTKPTGHPPLEAARRMTVPDGFTTKLIAGEPDLNQPIALTIDERGRIWVAEAHAYPVRRPDGEGQDKIVVFADEDHDGTYETRTVFADDLNLVSGLEVGLGGVWIGAAPYLLFIPDADRDLVPDGPPVTLLDGWGYGDTHETLNSFIWGPDGWLYGCHGVFTHSKVGKPGTPDEDRVPLNAGVFRYHPTRHEFEVFAWGSSNPWGVDFNDYGQAFITACVIPHLFHVIQGGRYRRQSGGHFNPYVYDDIKTIADHLHYLGKRPHDGNGISDSVGGGHAHCGAMIYLGGAFPERYHGAVFMNNIHGNRINTDLPRPSGSGFVGRHGPDFLLANDPWYRGINMKYGPDGGIYLIDWYDKQACHWREIEVWDRSNGRLYAVHYGDTKPIAVDLAKRSSEELVALHLERNEWWVRTARRILQERGPDPTVHAALAGMLETHHDPARVLRALWTLHVTGGLTDAVALEQLKSRHKYVRAWTIQLLLEDGEATPEQVDRLVELAADDTSPVVRLYLAAALQKLPLERRWDLATALVAHGEDQADHNLPLMIWYGVEPLVPADPPRALALAESSQIPLVERYVLRRLASGPDAHLDTLVDALLRTEDPGRRAFILGEMQNGLRRRQEVAMPAQWPELYPSLVATEDDDLRNQVRTLAVLFGDRSVLPELRATLADLKARRAWREQALWALVRFADSEVVPVLHRLLDDVPLRSHVIDALATFDHPDTPPLLVARYGDLNDEEKRAAVRTLTSRSGATVTLLEAIRDGRLPKQILDDALTRRQITSHNHAAITDLLTATWGFAQPLGKSVQTQIAAHKKRLTTDALSAANLARGRDLFSRTCMVCHKLFGTGGQIGPDITGSNRADLDYILTNIVDPNAEVAKDYMVTVIETKDERLVSGFIADQNDQTITLQGPEQLVTVALSDIAVDEKGKKKILHSTASLMPPGQLDSMTEEQVRDLIAYLGSSRQAPVPATPDNVGTFFNGVDLTGWSADPAVWSVENGEIVGRGGEGLATNSFAASLLQLRDFRLTLEVKLTPNTGNSGVQFRSVHLENAQMRGYQADIGAGWWGKLYEEHGRELLASESRKELVREDDWNTYEILAVGHRVQTALNGKRCVDLTDDDGATEGVIGLQAHAGGPMEIRFRKLALDLDPAPELETVQ